MGRKGGFLAAGVDVGTQTDGAVWGEVSGQSLADSWADEIFGGRAELFDDDLDSAVMLQRAAAATFMANDIKHSEMSSSALSAGIEMAIPDSPR